MSSFKVEDSVVYDHYKYERAQRLLSRITYKKWYKLQALPDGCISISTFVEDVLKPEQKIQIGCTVALSDLVEDEFAIRSIYFAILDMEKHEASEWFKVDGRAMFNEHEK